MKITRTLMLLLSLLSCNNKKYDYTYYESGELHEKIELNTDSIAHGEYLSYYPSGKLKVKAKIQSGLMQGIKMIYYENGYVDTKSYIKNDKLNGISLGYYENGNIAFKENYKNDLYYGEQIKYFELDSGKIEEKANFLIVKGKAILTGLKRYDKECKLIEERRHVKINTQTDTLTLGDTSIVQIEMIHPKFNRMDVWLANYDEQFYCDSTTLDSIPASNHIAEIPIMAKDTGTQYLRGYVDDYELHETDSGLHSLSSINNYFEYKYYVLPK